MIVNPMATQGVEPIGSMGTDIPLAVLSERPQVLYDYFKQLFAQVTNPPVDADRETIVMAIDRTIGPEGNLLEPTPESARQVKLPTPILLNAELEKIRQLDGGPKARGFRAVTLPMLFKVRDGGAGLRKAIDVLRRHASEAIAEGHNIVILSDRGPQRAGSAHPGAAGGVGHPAPPAERRLAHEGQPDHRVGRAARGAPLLPADRLRRERDQPVPRVRDDPRPAPPGVDHRRPQRGREALRQGRQQGHRQGDLQDGDLDDPELPRRAGLRGAGTVAGLRRRVLHRHAHAVGRHRHRRGGQGSEAAPLLGVPDAARRAHHAGHGRDVPVPRRRRAAPVQPGDDPLPPGRVPDGRLQALQEVRGPGEPPGQAPDHAARAHGPEAAAQVGADRRGGADRGHPRALQDRARCRTGRSARRRTRRWRSR